MSAFLATVLTFPTVLWSVLLAACGAYWALTAAGLLHPGDDGGVEDAGVLARAGLGGVPASVVLTALTLSGWLASYFAHLLLLPGVSGGARALLGLAVLLGSLAVATAVTRALLRPLRAVAARVSPPAARPLAGRVGTVTSPHVDETSGRAAVEDGGAGLILEVRAQPPDRPRRGDRIVILFHDRATNTYAVTSEDRFDA
ncbi:hypothetical protein [uncultured Deinococcus sp.]|uniref:hypothetical protein n=1 Tax=uncultured Deinococcus sp. TaxID=158789 RepID=UPI0025DD433A|nr:hypothetical protein [uncultured Deinococcus sp.]